MSDKKPCNYAMLLPAYVTGAVIAVIVFPLYVWESGLQSGAHWWKHDVAQGFVDARADAERLAEMQLARNQRRGR